MASAALVVDSHGEEEEPRLQPALRRPRALVALAVTAVGLVGGSLLFSRRLSPRRAGDLLRTAEGSLETEVTRLNLKNFDCSKYPYLKFDTHTPVLHNNLCHKGPDKGAEGIIYRTIDVGDADSDELGRSIILTVNATSHDGGPDCSYNPFSAKSNGMQGLYGSINLWSGSRVNLDFNFYDEKEFKAKGKSAAKLTMTDLALTMFDLDTGKDGTSTEFVELSGFDEYKLTDDTEVQVHVKSHHGGATKFSASTEGTGEDNPTDPMALTAQQQNRAVTALYKNAGHIRATIGAGKGKGPRFFTFVFRPSLLCAITVQEGFKPRLPDLVYKPPMQVPVKVHMGEEWTHFLLLHRGQRVPMGFGLFLTQTDKGSHTYRAPCAGTIIDLQGQLRAQEKVDLRLDDHTVVVLQKDYLDPLPGQHVDHVVPGGPGPLDDDFVTFVKWLIPVGKRISKGDKYAIVKDHSKQHLYLTAHCWGVLNARQDELDEGDYIISVKDNNMITCGPYPALETNHEVHQAAVVEKGKHFVKYHVKVGDVIKHGDLVATVRDTRNGHFFGPEIDVHATKGGIVTGRQVLEEGTPINRIPDRNLIVVGKFAALEVTSRQAASSFAKARTADADTSAGARTSEVKVPEESLKFIQYHVSEGDIVEDGQKIATLEDEATGKRYELVADQPGVVLHLQNGLKEGMLVSKVLQDKNLATIDRLPELDLDSTQRGAYAPKTGDWLFSAWLVEVGDDVVDKQPVAKLHNDAGETKVVRSTKGGTVTARQDHLRVGDHISEVTEDNDLLTIGPFKEIGVGFTEAGVQVEMDDIFDFWMVKEGKHVKSGQQIAQVTRGAQETTGADGTARRLASQKIKVLSPGTGTVSYTMPLKPGESIRDQSVGPTIAKIEVGMPWWVWMLLALLVLLAILAAVFMLMKKPVPLYEPMVAAELVPEPEPVREEPKPVAAPPKPDGLRLDFDDKGTRRTVYAKYRPLGIKHNHVAPIIAHDFTINSYAKMELGVKDSWKLVRIGEEELDDNSNFDDVNDKLHGYTKNLPIWPLVLEFKKPDSSTTTASFTERPIGLEFSNLAPIKVGKIYADSPAARAKVQLGWYLTKIGEADVHESHNFREVMKLFKEGVNALDDSGRKYT